MNYNKHGNESYRLNQIILVHWYDIPSRPELIAPFIELSNHCKVILLYDFKKDSEKIEKDKIKRIYWYDYSSPQKILDTFKPDKLVFAGLESLYAIALNYQAKKLNIPTFELQHGVVNKLGIDKLEEAQSDYKISKLLHYMYVLKFYIKGAMFNSNLLRLLWLTIVNNNVYAVRKLICEERLPTFYLCFTIENALFYKLRDGEIGNRLIEFGNPFLDDLFIELNKKTTRAISERYILLIDTVFSLSLTTTPQSQINLYQALAKYAKDTGHKLVIKLHPHAYNYQQRPNIENTLFIKDIPLLKLVRWVNSAEKIFSFFSSLLIPMIATQKNIITIEIKDEIPEKWVLNKLVAKNIKFDSFNSQNFYTLPKSIPKSEAINEFIQSTCYKIDGKATKRLNSIILK